MISFHDGAARQCHVSVTEKETTIQNLYWLTNFYQLIRSTSISPMPIHLYINYAFFGLFISLLERTVHRKDGVERGEWDRQTTSSLKIALPTKRLALIHKLNVNYWTSPLQMYECCCIYIKKRLAQVTHFIKGSLLGFKML